MRRSEFPLDQDIFGIDKGYNTRQQFNKQKCEEEMELNGISQLRIHKRKIFTIIEKSPEVILQIQESLAQERQEKFDEIMGQTKNTESEILKQKDLNLTIFPKQTAKRTQSPQSKINYISHPSQKITKTMLKYYSPHQKQRKRFEQLSLTKVQFYDLENRNK